MTANSTPGRPWYLLMTALTPAPAPSRDRSRSSTPRRHQEQDLHREDGVDGRRRADLALERQLVVDRSRRAEGASRAGCCRTTLSGHRPGKSPAPIQPANSPYRKREEGASVDLREYRRQAPGGVRDQLRYGSRLRSVTVQCDEPDTQAQPGTPVAGPVFGAGDLAAGRDVCLRGGSEGVAPLVS